MELWIRTQSKQSLVKVDNVSITERTKTRYSVDSGEWTLGRYNSFERALEVLNEIQNILQPRLIVHQPNIDYNDMIHSLTEDICLRTTQKVDMELKQAGQVVYQMPKE